MMSGLKTFSASNPQLTRALSGMASSAISSAVQQRAPGLYNNLAQGVAMGRNLGLVPQNPLAPPLAPLPPMSARTVEAQALSQLNPTQQASLMQMLQKQLLDTKNNLVQVAQQPRRAPQLPAPPLPAV